MTCRAGPARRRCKDTGAGCWRLRGWGLGRGAKSSGRARRDGPCGAGVEMTWPFEVSPRMGQGSAQRRYQGVTESVSPIWQDPDLREEHPPALARFILSVAAALACSLPDMRYIWLRTCCNPYRRPRPCVPAKPVSPTRPSSTSQIGRIKHVARGGRKPRAAPSFRAHTSAGHEKTASAGGLQPHISRAYTRLLPWKSIDFPDVLRNSVIYRLSSSGSDLVVLFNPA